MACGIVKKQTLKGGKRSRRRYRNNSRNNCHKKSHRHCKHGKKRRKQRGGTCGACNTGQIGGGAFVNAIVPTFILTALYQLTRKNKHLTKRRGSMHKRRR